MWPFGARIFGVLARLRRRSMFENPVTEPKRRQNPKRPLRPARFPNGYSIFENALVPVAHASTPAGSGSVPLRAPITRQPPDLSHRSKAKTSATARPRFVPLFFLLHSSFCIQQPCPCTIVPMISMIPMIFLIFSRSPCIASKPRAKTDHNGQDWRSSRRMCDWRYSPR